MEAYIVEETGWEFSRDRSPTPYSQTEPRSGQN
jgi:hypothetical protein